MRAKAYASLGITLSREQSDAQSNRASQNSRINYLGTAGTSSLRGRSPMNPNKERDQAGEESEGEASLDERLIQLSCSQDYHDALVDQYQSSAKKYLLVRQHQTWMIENETKGMNES